MILFGSGAVKRGGVRADAGGGGGFLLKIEEGRESEEEARRGTGAARISAGRQGGS